MISRHPFSVEAARNQVHLRIMETTDLHMHLLPYDYYADKPSDAVGLSRTAALIRSARQEAHNSLLLDNGDFLQGNPMGDYIAYERGLKDGDLHPVIQAMNTLEFDAATIGNHEFNYGLDFLMASLAGAAFPVVLANLLSCRGTDPLADDTLFEPYALLDRSLRDGAGDRHDIRIGVIGFTPPQVTLWDRRHLEGRVESRDIVETAKAYLPQMREAGADIILALCHTGIGAAHHREGMENAAVPLAALDGIDALLTGHSHLVFPAPSFDRLEAVDPVAGTIHGKPAVMGGFWGSHLGLIDLLLEREDGRWRVRRSTSEARPIARRTTGGSTAALVADDADVHDAVARDHARTLSYIRRPVGHTAVPLHSYFALVTDDPSVQIVSDAQRWYITQMLAGTPHADLPLLSAAAPFKAGGRSGPDFYTDMPAGPLAIKNVADLYLFPNTVRAVRVTGAELRGWLERSAALFNRVDPGARDATLLNPDFPSYNFDVLDGVRYRIDLSRPSRFDARGALVDASHARITDLTYQGRPVTDDMVFAVATNSYRAHGGGYFPGTGSAAVIYEAPDTNRDVVVRYILEQGTIRPEAHRHWSFVPMPETSVVFQTGPAARRYAKDLDWLDLEEAGAGSHGFARYRIRL